MTQNPVTVAASLNGSAAKLLLHLMLDRPGHRETPELMRGAGIGNRETFYAAKAQLVEKGLWENPTAVCGFPTAVSEKPTVVSEIPTVSDGKADSSVRFPDTSPPFATDTASLVALAPILGVPVPEESRNFSEDFEKSPLALCAEADRMPADGDRLRPTSEFQARRRAQVQAICLTWSKLFPEQQALTTSRAKELLVAANDVAEDVYDALQSSAGKDYPFGYARKILANTPKPATGAASQSEDHTGEKMDWTPEMEAKTQAGIEKLRRMQGAKPRWFGEDA